MELLEAKEYVLSELVGKNLSYLYPVNYSEERKKFFKSLKEGKEYNPRFVYPAVEFKISRMMNSIRQLVNYKGKHSQIVNSFGHRADLFLKLILVRANEEFTKVSEELYGFPSKEVLQEAERVLRELHEESPDPAVYGSKQVASRLRPFVEKYGWGIERRKIPVRMKVSKPDKKLIISTYRKFSDSQVERLRVHEVETHIRRAYENERIPEPVKNCFDYIQTEEGLAVKMEELEGVATAETQRRYAARALAVQKARHSSFAEVFGYLSGFGFSKREAFHITSRVKRGMGDTAMKGGLTRDHIYMTGKKEVEKYLEEGDLEDLFIGKIGVKDVAKVEKIIE